MPIEEIRGELSLPQKQIIDGFDEAAKGLAAGTISRRRALKLTGTALLGGGLLALFAGVAGAQVSVQQGCAARRPSAIIPIEIIDGTTHRWPPSTKRNRLSSVNGQALPSRAQVLASVHLAVIRWSRKLCWPASA
jgi:hypothetical protein